MLQVSFLILLVILCGYAPAPAFSYLHCSRPADVIFLLDSSKSIGEDEFKKQLSFVQQVVEYFDVSRGNIRVGLILYTDVAVAEFNLARYSSKEFVKDAVGRIFYVGGDGRNSHLAIKKADEHMFQYHWVHNYGLHMIVYITTGKATDHEEAVKEAQEAKKGSMIFTLGVGSQVDMKKLGQLATQDSNQFVFNASSFDDLLLQKYTVARQICSGGEDRQRKR
uniref:VWACP-6 n=1 Tax=Colubraria reticulata TaxID=604273 RepID=A0AA96ZP25_9CAEN|nr:VWACP-6 [Colubraria reticulata]